MPCSRLGKPTCRSSIRAADLAVGSTGDVPPPKLGWRAHRRPLATLVGIWLVWAVVLLGYQELVAMRFAPERPDGVLEWTATETELRSHAHQPFLLDPTLRAHTAWDSEFYLAIAVHGYDSPDVATYEPAGWRRPDLAQRRVHAAVSAGGRRGLPAADRGGVPATRRRDLRRRRSLDRRRAGGDGCALSARERPPR